MDFLMEITKIWQKSRDFWLADFFLEIFEIRSLVLIFLWIMGCFESISSMFCLKLLPGTNFILDKRFLSKSTFGSIFVS
jgi:hypothetical protein